jgi:hypothetical protein
MTLDSDPRREKVFAHILILELRCRRPQKLLLGGAKKGEQILKRNRRPQRTARLSVNTMGFVKK